ncbi:N-glycosylase/DNA lyase, putative [Plasmodium gallinaceum]|uniref:DNA-(apurinic or apyrimidinic site) lyase n=1 Tax=Plasmodium gallinaceum TaxID=5849 RepID=A0A1J1GVZ7_PLAGA|nr:N-glycosylase/DNA lyase, putative [Plasmodium gallinaceum]CRG96720.1 N-glycosylase/DNA lyase, putative [Plasmodium gallinaceum]
MKIYYIFWVLSIKYIYICKYINKNKQTSLNNISNIHGIKYNLKVENKMKKKIFLKIKRENIKKKKILNTKINGFTFLNNMQIIKKKKFTKISENNLLNNNIKDEKIYEYHEENNEENNKENNYEKNEYESKEIHYIINNYEKNWYTLNVTKNDLQLIYCFLIGQEFCFSEVECNKYIGLINKKIFLFKETENNIFYQCLYDNKITLHSKKNNIEILNCDTNENQSNYEKELQDFFNLKFPLDKNMEAWKKKDKRMNEISNKIKGLRILKVDPVESFFAFLCSSNNNIPRITLMIDCLKRRYGKFLATIIFQDNDIIIKTKNEMERIKEESNTISNMKKIHYENLKIKKENYENIKKNIKTEDDETINKNIKNKSYQSIKVNVKTENDEYINKNIEKNRFKSTQKKTKIESDKYLNNDLYSGKNELLCDDNKTFYENVKKMIKEERKMKTFDFYEFPKIETLSKLKEEDLRSLGFGYRSNYIIESAKMLTKMGNEKWIEDLRKEEKTKDCIDKLVKFPGIGLKVANCICLFGLNRFDCIPIDTHIYDIIYKYYNNLIENVDNNDSINKNKYSKKNLHTNKNTRENANDKHIKIPQILDNVKINDQAYRIQNTKQKKKTLTKSLYIKLFTKLKNLFGPNCGWAQTILFVSELKKFGHLFE